MISPRWRFIWSGLAIALILATCTPTSPMPLPAGNSLTLVQTNWRAGMSLRVGQFALYPVVLEAEQAVELRRATPIHIDNGAEFLDSRVVLRPGGRAIICGTSWPLPGYGPAVELEGFRLKAGDWFFVVFYVGARENGEWSSRGARIEYTMGGREYVQLFEESVEMILDVAEDKDCKVQHPDPCLGTG